MLATFVVDTTVDENDGTGVGDISLRDAITAAAVSGDTIEFDPSQMNGATISLTLGELEIEKTITIDATMLTNGLTIAANDPTPTQNNFDGSRIFNITDPTSGTSPPVVTLVGLTLTGGDVNGSGGAILSQVQLAVIDCTITGNNASSGGGGIHSFPTGDAGLTIADSVISGNSALFGGGVYSYVSENASVEITDSQITGNSASGASGSDGGGILASLRRYSALTIAGSVISGNSARQGGGIHSYVPKNASATITDSEISGNSATGATTSTGGGVFAKLGEGVSHTDAQGSEFTMQRSRVDGNTATNRGGGIFTTTGSGGLVTVDQSAITGNKAGEDLTGGSGTIPNSGGGMYAYMFSYQGATKLTISGSEISDNTAGKSGGGLQVCTKREDEFSQISQLSLFNSTISGNTAGHTTMANEPGEGGGVHLAIYTGDPEEALDTRIQNSTITGNTADQGGGVYSLVPPNYAAARNDARLTNSIVSANEKHNGTDPSNLHGSFNIDATDFNLIGQSGTGNAIFSHTSHQQQALSTNPSDGNIFTDDPKLGALQLNGGLTRTHGLLPDSDAIDAGSNSLAVMPFTSTPLSTDQRGTGFSRIRDIAGEHDPGAIVDIGAYEVNFARVTNVVLRGSGWGMGVEYSYAEVVAAGDQHRPMYIKDANRIEVHFDSAVSFPTNQADALVIWDERNQEIAATIGWVNYDSNTFVATWSVSTPLGPGKYAIQVLDVTGAGGTELDGDWTNYDGPVVDGMVERTPDNFNDDPGQTLLSGNGVEGGLFQFHISVLPGDYNQDGKVRNATGPGGEPSDLLTLLDGDGDGAPSDTTDDTAIVNNAVTAGEVALDASKYYGDYVDDDWIDGSSAPDHMMDYMRWKATFNSTNVLDADGNDNGTVDSADYTLWRNYATYQSAWYTGGMGTAPALPIVDFTNPPQVTNVTVSGSASIHADYSFDAHDGSGEQLRTVPVGGADTISVTFSEDVNVSASQMRLVGLYSGNIPEFAEFSYDIGTMTATWRFVGWTFGDQYALVLDDSITDVEGRRLDGEWTNPEELTTTNTAVSEFPSGDGNAGGDFEFIMTLLPGDANLDLAVTSADLTILQNHFNNGQIDELFSEGDFTGDGVVDFDDVALYSPHSGLNLGVVWVLADLDGDFDVDDDDAETMADNMGMSNPTWADGDLDDNNAIDLDDLDLLFAQFGLDLEVVS
jgi:hypothetical protein